MSYFRSHPEDAAAVGHIWQTMSLRVDRENIQFEVPWNDSIMQGQEGFGSSMRHSHILARFLRRMNAIFPAMVSSHAQSLTNIDDVIFALMHRGDLKAGDASRMFSLLKEVYLELGDTVNRTKSILSTTKFIYLSRYFAQGIEILMPLKVMVRSALLCRNTLPEISGNLEAVSGIFRAIERQSGCAMALSSLYYMRCVEEVANLVRFQDEDMPDVRVAALVLSLPLCFGGLNIKDFPTVCRGRTKVSSLSVCDMLDAIIHMVFIAK